MGGFKSSIWVVAGMLSYSAPSHALDHMTDNIRSLQTMSDGFAELAAQVKSGVVAIATERTVVEDGGSNPFFGFQMPPQERQRDGAGSGVIVRFKGSHYILTNNHVINGADNIRVDLSDSRFFEAEIVGADSLSDLALLKIGGKDLPAVELGDSDALREGEWVLAIGNPFGIAHSISTGIISGLGRGRSREEYGSYIQTDAAINPGNSGGALINVRGELIGINAAIVPGGGGPFGRVGNVGIGFAIPINQAKFVMGELVEHGRVRRGLLGVQIRDLNPLLAEAMGLETKDGVLISEVMEGRAADKGGVKEEDIVLEINGEKVHDSTELKSIIGRTAPGSKVELLVLRDGDKKRLGVVLEALTEEVLASARSERGEAVDPGRLGLALQELTPELADRLGYDEDEEGVVITRVRAGSEAARRGLQRGLLITGINRTRVRSLDEYQEALEAIEPGEAFALRVQSQSDKRLIAMRMPTGE